MGNKSCRIANSWLVVIERNIAHQKKVVVYRAVVTCSRLDYVYVYVWRVGAVFVVTCEWVVGLVDVILLVGGCE